MDLWTVFWVLLAVAMVAQLINESAKQKRKSTEAAVIKKKARDRLSAARMSVSAILAFEPEMQYLNPLTFFLATDKTMTQFFYAKIDGFGGVETKLEFSGSDMVSFDVTEGGVTISTTTTGDTTTKGGLTRAAVGGATFGGVGAVVGAVTAKKEQKLNSRSSEKRGDATVRIGMRFEDWPILTLRMPAHEADQWAFALNRAFEMSKG